MKVFAILLTICGASIAAPINCNIISPICLHVYNTKEGNLTISCSNECDLNEVVESNNYTDYKSSSGRCFFKKCGEDAKKIINTGTPLCVNFESGESKNFDSETRLNKYLCENENEEVSSIPGSSRC